MSQIPFKARDFIGRADVPSLSGFGEVASLVTTALVEQRIEDARQNTPQGDTAAVNHPAPSGMK